MQWSEVTEKHDKIVIIGGGQSLTGVNLKPLNDFQGAIITVNNVIKYLERADYWMTVDPMTKEGDPQPCMVKQIPGVKYYCAFPNLQEKPFDLPYYKTVENVNYLERIVPEKGKYQLQEDKRKITTGDSVYGALGLAYHMGAKRIVLLGVDGYGYGHWYDPASPYNAYGMRDFKKKYLDNIPGIYQNSVEQLARRGAVVINGSPRSIVKCFQKTSPQKAINWILNENVKG